jgi:hypothetical protein
VVLVTNLSRRCGGRGAADEAFAEGELGGVINNSNEERSFRLINQSDPYLEAKGGITLHHGPKNS